MGVSNIYLSRRGLMQGAFLAGGVLAATDFSARSASAAIRTEAKAVAFSADPFVLATAQVFDSAWARQITALFPMGVSLIAGDSAIISVGWDARLFAVDEPAICTVGGAALELAFLERDDSHVRLRVPAGAERVFIPARGINLYPQENIGLPKDVWVELASTDGVTLQRRAVANSISPCTAWSVEATVDWVTMSGSVTPARVNILSVGPADVPAGAEFNLSYPSIASYPTILDDDDLPAPEIAVSATRVEGTIAMRIAVVEPIRVGRVIRLHFPEDAADSSTPALDPALVSSLRMSPLADSTGLRVSGKHSAFPLTPSGSPLSTFALEATA